MKLDQYNNVRWTDADGDHSVAFDSLSPEDQAKVQPADLPPAPTPLEEIQQLEAAHPITHRNLRDLSMAVASIAEVVTGQPAADLPLVKEIQALEQQIAALRAQL